MFSKWNSSSKLRRSSSISWIWHLVSVSSSCIFCSLKLRSVGWLFRSVNCSLRSVECSWKYNSNS